MPPAGFDPAIPAGEQSMLPDDDLMTAETCNLNKMNQTKNWCVQTEILAYHLTLLFTVLFDCCYTASSSVYRIVTRNKNKKNTPAFEVFTALAVKILNNLK
jgi:hypothetical protein